MKVTSEHNVITLDQPRLRRARHALALAFHDDPLMRYCFPNPRKRQESLQWLFGKALRYGLRYGTIMCTPQVEGVAIWLGPCETSLTLGRELRTGMIAAPFALGVRAMLRLRVYAKLRDQLHAQALDRPHWYLFAAAVHPSAQGRGVATALLQPILDRADADHLPCYLETTNEQNLHFFARFGFETSLHERMANRGPNVWAMLRGVRL